MKHFKLSEFECKCGCGRNEMDEGFLEKLDYARDIANTPFLINSGFRCPDHNKAIKSNSNNHPSGHATDIQCLDSQSRYKIITAMFTVGFTRIGIHPKFIHCDDNPEGMSNVIWFY